MSLSSTSTDAEVQASYDDNASYLEDNDVAKARAFRTACVILLRRTKSKVSDGGSESERELSMIQKQYDAVDAWVVANDDSTTNASRTQVTLGDFRDMRM